MENTNIEKLNKEPMTTKQKVILGLKIAGNVVFYVVIILLFLFSIMNINAGGKGGIPNLFGKGYLSVKTNSMTVKGTLPEYYNDYKIGSRGSQVTGSFPLSQKSEIFASSPKGEPLVHGTGLLPPAGDSL